MYDVKNLYPSIPIDETLKLIEKLLRESKTLVNITDLTVTVGNGNIEMDVWLALL